MADNSTNLNAIGVLLTEISALSKKRAYMEAIVFRRLSSIRCIDRAHKRRTRRLKIRLVDYLRACRQVAVKLQCAQDRLNGHYDAQEEDLSPSLDDCSLPSILSLPVEVLGEIFKLAIVYDFSVPPQGLSSPSSVCAMDMAWNISQVCAQWRQIAHSLPELWACIAVGYEHSHELRWPDGLKRMVDTALKRSRNCPLKIVFTAANVISDFTSLVLMPHASRIRHLEMSVLGPHIPSFADIGCEDFSALETFSFEVEIQTETTLPSSFQFLPRAPLLREVSLFDFSIECVAAQYSHLERIRGYVDSPGNFYRLFREARGLLDATIHLRQRYPSIYEWNERYHPVPVHDYLQRLSLSGYPAYNMVHFPNLRSLSISFEDFNGDLLPDNAYTIPDTYHQLSDLHLDAPDPRFPIVKVIASCPTESLTSLSFVIHTHTPIIQMYHALSLYMDGSLPMLRHLEIHQPYHGRNSMQFVSIGSNALKPVANCDAFGVDFLVMVQSRRYPPQGTARLQTLKLYPAHEIIPLSTYVALKKMKEGGLSLELFNYTLAKSLDLSTEED